MTYKTYITETIVCGSTASHTSDKSYLLFTREAGMLFATARSVREERSKQRYALQEFSYVRATLVHGKGGWRVAGVEPMGNFYAHAHTRAARVCVRAVILLLRRVVHGDVAHDRIFSDVTHGLCMVSECDARVLELVLSLRILATLGYVPPHPLYDAVLAAPTVEAACTCLSGDAHATCTTAIDRALSESHL